MALFEDRAEAGRRLAAELSPYAGRDDVVVLALPRGGVPVAYEVAKALGAMLDVFVVRKLGVPGHEELAMGAIATGGTLVLNEGVVRDLRVPQHKIDDVATREGIELERREREYRGARPPVDVRGLTVILIDDGLATGATMRAAVQALRRQEPRRVIVAVPTGAPDTCESIGREVDEIVCAETPTPFLGVGMWYVNFSQTTDDEVKRLLAEFERPSAAQASSAGP
jgi:putative phosphoribosyl transferase